MTRTFLRLVPVVAFALAVPWVLDRFGVVDVSWAPDPAVPVAAHARAVVAPVDALREDLHRARPFEAPRPERRLMMCRADALLDVSTERGPFTDGPAASPFDDLAP